jgi:hypothetical protein
MFKAAGKYLEPDMRLRLSVVKRPCSTILQSPLDESFASFSSMVHPPSAASPV